ncbi:MAG TPA: hypothetical protein VHZ26_03895 [Caulobacteraceae bacterium]|nr:hypothetical protein [Caulobacteraceae bacterium]
MSAGSLANRGVSIDEGVGKMANRGILLNLARASKGEPLYFVSIGNVQAQGTTDLRIGAPGFTEGASLPLAARQIIQSGTSTFLDNTINTNFQMGVFNTQTFYEGMLQPLGLNDIDLLLHQGFSREMVFYLVIEKAKVTPCPLSASPDPCILYNDPANPSYLLFRGAIEAAMEHGLVTEVPQNLDSYVAPTSPVTDQGAAGAQQQARAAAEQVAAQSSGGNIGNAGKIDFVLRPPTEEPKAQLCFERALSTETAKKQFDQLKAEGKPPFYCGSGHKRGSAPLTVRLFDGKDYQIVVTTRSIYGIFNYLGAVMDAPPSEQPMLVDYKVPSETTPAGPLLTVNHTGILATGCFTAVNYGGKGYCVPEDGAQTTKQVFNVLSALVALKQSPGDLPVAQTVLVAP